MATGNKKQGISWRDELYPSLAAARRRREEEELAWAARAPSGQPSAAEVLYPWAKGKPGGGAGAFARPGIKRHLFSKKMSFF